MAEEKNPTLKKAKAEMTYLTGDEAEQRMAELEEKWEMDRVSETNYARNQGRNEGKKEEQIEIAKKMLKKKLPVKLIIEITKLSKEEIDKLS